MPSHTRIALRSLVGLALVLVGCNTSTGPVGSLNDPAATAAQAAAIDSALNAPAIASFQALGGQLHMAPPVNRAVGALGALSLTGASQDHYGALAGQARALQQVVPGFASLAASAMFPDSLLGSVYAWNTDSGRYTRSAPTGGPANGLRFLLYATAPGAEQPSLPLVQVGYADLMDESSGGTARLHIVVKNNAGTVTFVDYTFSGTGNSASFTASVSGTVSNGLAGGANKTLSFTITLTGSSTAVTLTLALTLNNPAVTVQETIGVTESNSILTLAINFTFMRPGETVTLTGTVAISETDGSVTLNLTVTANGGTFATITGTTSHPVITRAGGGSLTGGELICLTYLFVAAANVSQSVNAIFEPAERILGF